MAKITPNSLVSAISGSTCHHDGTYFATNKQTGNVYAVKVCFPSTAEATEAQTTQRTAFGTKAKLVSAWLKTYKGKEQYTTVETAYKSQHKIGSLFGYIMKNSTVSSSGVLTVNGTTSGVSQNTGDDDNTDEM